MYIHVMPHSSPTIIVIPSDHLLLLIPVASYKKKACVAKGGVKCIHTVAG